MVEIASPRTAQVNFMMRGILNSQDDLMINEKPCDLYAEAGSPSHFVIWLQIC